MSEIDALQNCLAAEHADLFGYGVLGGVLAGFSGVSGLRGYADSCYAAHRSRRDRLTSMIEKLDASPVAADPAYRLPFRVTEVADCKKLARQLEGRSAAVYALAVAETVRVSRALAVDALTDCAIRQVAWGALPQALPGLGQT